MAVGEDPPGGLLEELPGEFELAGGEGEVGVDEAVGEPGEPVGEGSGDTEVDEDASLMIVNSGLALPESPNTVMSNEHGVSHGNGVVTYGRQYSLSWWGHQVP